MLKYTNLVSNPVFIIFIIMTGIFACKPERELKKIMADLHSSDSTLRFQAIQQIKEYKPVPSEQKYILEEAARSFPPAEYTWQSIPGILVETATATRDITLPDIIKIHYATYDTQAKEAALRFLASWPDPRSVNIYTELVMAHPEGITYLPTGALNKEFSNKSLIFPELLSLIKYEHLKDHLLLLLIDYCKADQLKSKEIIACLTPVIEYSKNSRIALQKQSGSIHDIWNDEVYQDLRFKAGICADMLGYLEDAAAITELREYLTLKDSKLKMFASVSLLRQHQIVDQTIIREIAANSESRKWLYQNLVSIQKQDLYPPQYKTQEAFAESDMVNWLLFPTELGRMPDAIELMRVVEVDSESDLGVVEFYLYRFKSLDSLWIDNGWMAGVSGFYPKKDKPSVEAYGYTFSTFEKWESKSSDQHVLEIRELLSESYEKNNE